MPKRGADLEIETPDRKTGAFIAHAETDFYPHSDKQNPVEMVSCGRVFIDVACLNPADPSCPQVILKAKTISGSTPPLVGCSIREENSHPLAVISRHGGIIGYLGVLTIVSERLVRDHGADPKSARQDP